jgi:hypothetical protein
VATSKVDQNIHVVHDWRELERRPANEALFRRPEKTENLAVTEGGSKADPYLRAGSHPDCVERVWDVLGATLPEDCKFLILGSAVLAHPSSGVVFAMPYGTRYALWIPEPQHTDAVAVGLVPTAAWSSGEPTDLTRELGPGWLFGAWKAEEVAWLAAAYKAAAG